MRLAIRISNIEPAIAIANRVISRQLTVVCRYVNLRCSFFSENSRGGFEPVIVLGPDDIPRHQSQDKRPLEPSVAEAE
jgi:hypothetical protein